MLEWLAIVILPDGPETRRRIFLIPRAVANLKARRDSLEAKTFNERYFRVDEIAKRFPEFEDNFSLLERGREAAKAASF